MAPVGERALCAAAGVAARINSREYRVGIIAVISFRKIVPGIVAAKCLTMDTVVLRVHA